MNLKKTTIALLCSMFWVAVIPVAASEEEYSFTDRYNIYKSMSGIDLYDNGCVVKDGVLIDYVGTDPEMVVPDGVVAIRRQEGVERWNTSWENVESIVVPESVQQIEDYAFQDARNLAEVSIPKATKIGMCAFEGCENLADNQGLVIINGVLHFVMPWIYDEETDTYVFNRYIDVPEGVTEIRKVAIDSENYRINELRLPASLREIVPQAFCKVTNVYFNDGIEFIPDFAFGSVQKMGRLPKTLKYMGDFTLGYGKRELEVPDGLEYLGNEVGIAAHRTGNFDYGELKITIKGYEGSYAHAHSINSETAGYINFVSMGESDNQNGAQYWTKDNFEYIGNRLVGYSSLTDTYNNYYFEQSKKLYLPDETEIIGSYAFAASNLTDCYFTLPQNVTTIEKRAFSSPRVKDVKWNTGLKSIGERSFYTSGLSEAVLPEGLEIIGEGAFEASGDLKNVTIPKSVKSIGKNAFRECRRLEMISIPEYVEVGEGAFKGCAGIADKNGMVIVNGVLYDVAECRDRGLIVPKTIKSISEDAFTGVTAKYIYVPEEIKEISSHAFSEQSVLFGKKGSAIQKYAEENKLSFYEVQEEEFNDIVRLMEKGVNEPYGDLNSNGKVELEDVVSLLKYSLKIKSGNVINYEKLDVNQNGEVDLADASMALKTALRIEKELFPERVPQIITQVD